jgi:deazaflavin-dependent oxidoreductase (nitroreductase family)
MKTTPSGGSDYDHSVSAGDRLRGSGGHWEGKTTLLLHVPGRKSGKEYVDPLVAAPDGDSFVICGSGGGAPADPQWMANLEAVDGPVTIELGAETMQADHRVVRPGETTTGSGSTACGARTGRMRPSTRRRRTGSSRSR